LLGSRRIAASPADGSSDLYAEQIGDDNGQDLRVNTFEEPSAGLMTWFTLVEGIDPYAGVNGVHPLSAHRQQRGCQGWHPWRIIGRKRIPNTEEFLP